MSGFLDISKDGKNEVLMGKICGCRLAACPRQSAPLRFFSHLRAGPPDKMQVWTKKGTICPIFTLPLSLLFFFFLTHTSRVRGTSSGLCRPARPGDLPLTWAWSHGGELRGRGGVSPDSSSKWLIAPTPPHITSPHPTLPPLPPPRAGRGPSASFLCGSETEITSGRGCVRGGRSPVEGRRGGVGVLPRRPWTRCSASAPAWCRSTDGRAGGQSAASHTDWCSPSLQGGKAAAGEEEKALLWFSMDLY